VGSAVRVAIDTATTAISNQISGFLRLTLKVVLKIISSLLGETFPAQNGGQDGKDPRGVP
jgi:hypothetical protein